MNNLEKYNEIFRRIFFLNENDVLENLAYNDVESWDSVGQMELLAAIEDEFGIELEPVEFMEFTSYKMGLDIMKKHGIAF